MKILLAVDGSPCSREAVARICDQPWRPGTEVKVLSVCPASVSALPDPIVVISDEYLKLLADEKRRRTRLIEEIVNDVQARLPEATVMGSVLSGSPGATIVEQAERWGADLIVLGSHGYGPVRRCVLGSVSLNVVLHAPCSVEVVRARHSPPPRRRSGAVRRAGRRAIKVPAAVR